MKSLTLVQIAHLIAMGIASVRPALFPAGAFRVNFNGEVAQVPLPAIVHAAKLRETSFLN